MKAQCLHARSSDLEKLGKERAERAINLLGPHLLPLINRVEVRLSGARPIDPGQMPTEWKEYRNLDRYELVGVIDVVSARACLLRLACTMLMGRFVLIVQRATSGPTGSRGVTNV